MHRRGRRSAPPLTVGATVHRRSGNASQGMMRAYDRVRSRAGDGHEGVAAIKSLGRLDRPRNVWSGRDERRAHGSGPFCRAGRKVGFGAPAHGPSRTFRGSTRPDACGRSIGTETRQAGLLAFGVCRSRASLPALRQWLDSLAPRDPADYSGGPATDSHRLPYHPLARLDSSQGHLSSDEIRNLRPHGCQADRHSSPSILWSHQIVRNNSGVSIILIPGRSDPTSLDREASQISDKSPQRHPPAA
jgi:hypothetical protein